MDDAINTFDVSKYRIANPFNNRAVRGEDIWNDDWISEDVSEINENEFKQMLEDLKAVGHPDGRNQTIIRVMFGNAGAGKSHLFSRLRHEMNGAVFFILISNPPLHHGHLEPFIMNSIMSCLGHNAYDKRYRFDFTQLEFILYSTLGRTTQFKGLAPENIYNYWKNLNQERYGHLIEATLEQVGKLPEMDIDSKTLNVFLSLLSPSRKKLAMDWLGGSQFLSDEEYRLLGVNGPIGIFDLKKFLNILGCLTRKIYPIIIVFDQLDSMKKENFQELEPILIDLYDRSPNFSCFVGLTRSVYDVFEQSISSALRGRLSFGLELSPIRKPEKRRALIRRRLQSRPLLAARKSDNIVDEYFPLNKDIVEILVNAGDVFIRTLLMDAENIYLQALSPSPIQIETLADKVNTEWHGLVAHFSTKIPNVDTASISQRLIELFEVVHWPEKIETAAGPLEDGYENFKGTDILLSVGGKALRLVGYDVQRTSSFPNLLQRLLEHPLPNTALVRDSRAPTSGRVTQQRLQEFRKFGCFFHLVEQDISDLHALGDFLANVRAGDYLTWKTDPEPSHENIMTVLSEMPGLVSKEIALIFNHMACRHDVPSEPEPPDATPLPQPPRPEKPLGIPIPPSLKGPAAVIHEVMALHRWLSFSRLFWLVRTKMNQDITPAAFHQEIKSLSASGLISLLPEDAHFPDNFRIIVWNRG
ncbi:MAG: hypothetical protein V1816_18830 [Pseudomonadota bacterium]